MIRFVSVSMLRAYMISAIAFGTLVFGTGTAAADTIGVHFLNSESEDMFVTLTDQNAGKIVLDKERINRYARKTVEILKDGDGRGKVSWSAIIDSAEARKVKCGKGDKSSVSVGTEVSLTARDPC